MKRILLVDDSATFARILKEIVREHFEIVGHAKDGREGFEFFKTLKPDIVLLDITMPNLSGKDCLALILRENPAAQVIMVSSLGDQQTVNECLKLGAKEFVDKDSIRLGKLPDNASLHAALNRLFEGKKEVAS